MEMEVVAGSLRSFLCQCLVLFSLTYGFVRILAWLIFDGAVGQQTQCIFIRGELSGP